MFSARFVSVLVATLMAISVTQAFVHSQSNNNRVDTMQLASFLEGSKFDPSQNPLARGGKNSWEFEMDTMYVEEPKKKDVKVAAKSATYGGFTVTKKTPPKKGEFKNPFSALFGN